MPHKVEFLQTCTTGWPRPIGYLIFGGHFLQKSPVICGSFAKRDLQLKTSYGGCVRESKADVCVCERRVCMCLPHTFCAMNIFPHKQNDPTMIGRLPRSICLFYRSLFQKSHIKETIFCRRALQFYEWSYHDYRVAYTMCLLQMSSLKTYVSFAKELPKNMCFLQKSPMFHSSQEESAHN